MRRPVKITTACIHDRADMPGSMGVGAAEGCDLLIFDVIEWLKIKRSQPAAAPTLIACIRGICRCTQPSVGAAEGSGRVRTIFSAYSKY